jgi:RNA polymerase subunit RPABC4/transcription elongation factor Spt4
MEKIKKTEPCRNCKAEVETNVRRCQYCGILNPTVKTKDVFITIFIIITVMSLYTYFIGQ